MTEPPASFATPVFKVDQELKASLARDCQRMDIEESTEGLKTLRLHLAAVGPGATGPPAPLLYMDGKAVDFGKRIQVAVGPDTQQRTVFEGTVSAIETVFTDGQPPFVIVSAEDALMKLRMTRRCRTYIDTTDADIARKIAGDHGLRAEVDADGPRYDVVQQVNQNDLAFLRERARLIAAELWCSGSALHFKTREKRRATKLTLTQGSQLLSLRLCADLAHQRSEVVVAGYDAQTASVIDQRAGREAVVAQAQPGRIGADVLEKSLGPSVSLRVREVSLTTAEASAYAKAEMLRRARGFVTVTGTTRGSPDMIVGSAVDLRSVGRPFDGDGYYVTRVQHSFNLEVGLRTRFEAERATLNEVG